jgi:hypothetical protein
VSNLRNRLAGSDNVVNFEKGGVLEHRGALLYILSVDSSGVGTLVNIKQEYVAENTDLAKYVNDYGYVYYPPAQVDFKLEIKE